MLVSLRKNGLTSLFKEVRALKVINRGFALFGLICPNLPFFVLFATFPLFFAGEKLKNNN